MLLDVAAVDQHIPRAVDGVAVRGAVQILFHGGKVVYRRAVDPQVYTPRTTDNAGAPRSDVTTMRTEPVRVEVAGSEVICNHSTDIDHRGMIDVGDAVGHFSIVSL